MLAVQRAVLLHGATRLPQDHRHHLHDGLEQPYGHQRSRAVATIESDPHGTWKAEPATTTAIFDNFQIIGGAAAPANQAPVARPGGPYGGRAVACIFSNGSRRVVSRIAVSASPAAVLLTSGPAGKEIAGRLAISRRTAEHHVQHIYTKLGVSSRAAAALFAMEHELLNR